ncbi:MAG: agmatinase, partial [Actinomycetota bacterium]
MTEPQRDLPPGYQDQLDQGYAFGSVMTFAQRPLLTSPQQLDSWQPDVAVVGAPFDLGTSNRPGA